MTWEQDDKGVGRVHTYRVGKHRVRVYRTHPGGSDVSWEVQRVMCGRLTSIARGWERTVAAAKAVGLAVVEARS